MYEGAWEFLTGEPLPVVDSLLTPCDALSPHMPSDQLALPRALRPAPCMCRVFEKDGVQVVCDTVSMDFLKGAVVEFEDSLMRSAFQVGNWHPHAAHVTLSQHQQ